MSYDPISKTSLETFTRLAIATGTGSSATISFTSISGDYDHLIVRAVHRCTSNVSTTQVGSIEFNADTTGTNYYWWQHYGGSSQGSGDGDGNSILAVPTNNALASSYANAEIHILRYTDTSVFKIARAETTDRRAAASAFNDYRSVQWENTAAITRIDLKVADGNWATTAEFELIGVKVADVATF